MLQLVVEGILYMEVSWLAGSEAITTTEEEPSVSRMLLKSILSYPKTNRSLVLLVSDLLQIFQDKMSGGFRIENHRAVHQQDDLIASRT